MSSLCQHFVQKASFLHDRISWAWFDSVTFTAWCAYKVRFPRRECVVSLRNTRVQRVQRSTSPPHKPLAGRCLATSTLKLVSDTYYMAPVLIISWISFSRGSVKNWRVWRECSVLATTLRRHQLPGLWFWLILWDVGQPGKCLELVAWMLQLPGMLAVGSWSQGENWSIYTARWGFGNTWPRGEAAW